MDSENISWEEIESFVEIISSKIKSMNKSFSTIYTPSRGGLVPSRLLADRLNIKKIIVDPSSIPENSLFVDDIYDSGKTFEKFIDKVSVPESLTFVTLFARMGNKIPPQLIYATLTKGNEYVVFPWDRFEFKLNNC